MTRNAGISVMRIRRRQPRFERLECRITPTAELTLATFNTVANPIGNLTADSSGDLFGTTTGGGDFGYGEVFEIVHGQNSISPLASFNGTNGQSPNGQLFLDASGNLFGTTESGGLNQQGTVFEISHGTGIVVDLVSFNGANGKGPTAGLLQDASGNLFGTTEYGGSGGYGTVFEIAAGSGTFSTVANCEASTPNPVGPLVLDSSGDLLGTLQFGPGNVFMIPHGTDQIGMVQALNSIGVADLAVDSASNIYGTSGGGGANGDGAIFEISPSSGVQTFSFNGTNGKQPDSSVYVDAQGDVFGTTEYGGSRRRGRSSRSLQEAKRSRPSSASTALMVRPRMALSPRMWPGTCSAPPKPAERTAREPSSSWAMGPAPSPRSLPSTRLQREPWPARR